MRTQPQGQSYLPVTCVFSPNDKKPCELHPRLSAKASWRVKAPNALVQGFWDISLDPRKVAEKGLKEPKRGKSASRVCLQQPHVLGVGTVRAGLSSLLWDTPFLSVRQGGPCWALADSGSCWASGHGGRGSQGPADGTLYPVSILGARLPNWHALKDTSEDL